MKNRYLKNYKNHIIINAKGFKLNIKTIQEGADMIIIKPAISYLDIIYRAKQNFQIPLIAYQVSAEYAMLKALEKNNDIDFSLSCYENLIAMKRAGANSIISYASLEIAKAISAKSF